MEEEKRKAYSEVIEILKMIDDEERMEKIPFEVIQLLKSNSDPMYKPTFSKEIPLESQNLRKETYSIMAWIANKYWNEEIETEPNENDENIENKEKQETSAIVNITNASVYNDIEPETLDGQNLPMLISDISWYERIKIKIIKLLKTIFRIKDKKEGAVE